MNQLKDYLRRHNQNVTGKKAELALRAKRGEQTCESWCNLWESGRESIRTTTDRNASGPAWREAPRSILLVNWVKDLLQIPHFTEGDIYNYVVLKMGIKSRWGLKCTQTDMFMIFSTAQSVMCVITVLWNVKWFQLQMRRKTPPNRWPGCINDLPLYDTLYIINLQCTFSVGAMVSSLIKISTRSTTINKPKGADKRYQLGVKRVCLRLLYVCKFRANIFL